MSKAKPFVTKQKRQFDDDFYHSACLYSGQHSDMVPQQCVRITDNNQMVFQIPGGGGLRIEIATAMKWALAILDICQTVTAEIERQQK